MKNGKRANLSQGDLLMINIAYTHDILPNGANAARMSSVVISGLRSPTNTWK
jgi:hypothetical protein